MRRGLSACLLLLLLAVPAAAQQQGMPGGAPRELRVATGDAPPFVLHRGEALSGFSMELWTAIAQRLGVATRWINLGRRTDDAQIEAVAKEEADLAISAITMTPARESRVDFTFAYYDSGLQVAVSPAAQQDGDLPGLSVLRGLPLDAIGDLVLAGAAILIVLAHLLWLVERRRNPQFQRGYIRGIGEGIWGVILIFATGEHGDREAPPIVKRFAVAGMWLLGVVLIAQFTATVTSNLTVQQLQSNIRGPDDLPGKAIITVPGSIAAEWLQSRGLPFHPISSAEEALSVLKSGAAQAVVYDAPTLRYWSRTFGPDQLQVVGPVFRPQKYGIAVAQGSPLRKAINAALLEMMLDGSYEEISKRWFGDGG